MFGEGATLLLMPAPSKVRLRRKSECGPTRPTPAITFLSRGKTAPLLSALSYFFMCGPENGQSPFSKLSARTLRAYSARARGSFLLEKKGTKDSPKRKCPLWNLLQGEDRTSAFCIALLFCVQSREWAKPILRTFLQKSYSPSGTSPCEVLSPCLLRQQVDVRHCLCHFG